MNLLLKTPTELFKSIPEEVLQQLVVEKQQQQQIIITYTELLNQIMLKHIINKYVLPNFVSNKEDLIRWLLCIYVLE